MSSCGGFELFGVLLYLGTEAADVGSFGPVSIGHGLNGDSRSRGLKYLNT